MVRSCHVTGDRSEAHPVTAGQAALVANFWPGSRCDSSRSGRDYLEMGRAQPRTRQLNPNRRADYRHSRGPYGHLLGRKAVLEKFLVAGGNSVSRGRAPGNLARLDHRECQLTIRRGLRCHHQHCQPLRRAKGSDHHFNRQRGGIQRVCFAGS